MYWFCIDWLYWNTLIWQFNTVKVFHFLRYMMRYSKKWKFFWLSDIFIYWHLSTTVLTQIPRRTDPRQLIYIVFCKVCAFISSSITFAFISSSVTFMFKFPIQNFLLFCFSCWLNCCCCFWRCWSKWRCFWWCLFWRCCCEFSLDGSAVFVRRGSGLSESLVCYFANDTAWLFCCFAAYSDSTSAKCLSNRPIYKISFFVLKLSLKLSTLFPMTLDNEFI